MKKTPYISKNPNAQGLIEWTQIESATWKTLITRQREALKNRAAPLFMDALSYVEFSTEEIPQLPFINNKLKDHTGWEVQSVAAIIGPDEFFTLLSNKKFPVATFIRTPEELDYLEEPDIFHELFGHVPLLTNQTYADFIFEFGKRALELSPKDKSRLFRLFWFTVEFGLMNTSEGERAYGAGILSSIGETNYALTHHSEKVPFDLLNVLRTPFRVDIMQPLYYVINSFEELYEVLDCDLQKVIDESRRLGDFPPLFEPKDQKCKAAG